MCYCVCSTPVAASWAEGLGLLGAIVAGVWTLVTWRKDVKQKRIAAYERLRSDYVQQGIQDAFKVWTRRRTSGDLLFRGNDFNPEMKDLIDKVLPFLAHVRDLKVEGMIEQKTYNCFAAAIQCLTTDKEVDDYLSKLREEYPTDFPYDNLSDMMDVRIKEANAAVPVLTDEVWCDYLALKFGGMTDSAQSVKARASVVIKKLGVSMDDAVKDRETAQRTIQQIGIDFADKSKAQVSNYKNAIRHCFAAKHSEQL